MSQISIFSSEVKFMINEKQARKYCKEDITCPEGFVMGRLK